MRSVFLFALVLGAVAMLVIGGTGGAHAQSANNSSPTPGDDVDAGESIDSRTTLASWSYDGGTWTLRFHLDGERPHQATISGATQPGEGASQFAIQEERLLPGETTVTINARENGGESAVSITTPDSLENGHGVVVSTGTVGTDPFAPFGGTSGVFSGVGLSVVMSGAASAWVLWREEDGVMKA